MVNELNTKLALHQRYVNRCNVSRRTIFCHDNLEILQGINSECIDLIYLDPPFNKKKVFTAPLGTSAERASFKDIFYQEDIKEEWLQTIKEDHYTIYELLNAVKNIEGRTSYNFCYLAYLAIRLIECHRILKHTGSMYLHCDPTMSHYLKLLLDCIFGERQFRNEIVWSYQGTGEPMNKFKSKHDVLLFYAKSHDTYFSNEGSRERISAFSKSKYTKEDEKGKYKEIKHPDGSIHRQYIREYQRKRDVWVLPIINAMAKERTGYPTQKPLALLECVIEASSNEGDVVLDPFCGCATTCVAAEKLGRHWIGIDISHRAYELVQERLKREVWSNPDALYQYSEQGGGAAAYPTLQYSVSPPRRTDRDSGSKDRKHVYIISHPNYPDEYKVGIAGNVKSRLNAYQTSDPDRQYKIEYSVETEHYREIEAYIHRTFENKHEWVRAKLSDIKKAMAEYRLGTVVVRG